MEMVQGYTLGKKKQERSQASSGLAGWIAGALQGRVRIRWRGTARRVPHMQTLESHPLGGKRQLLLVTCDGERYLVGCGPDSVSSIVKLTSTSVEVSSTAKALAQTWL